VCGNYCIAFNALTPLFYPPWAADNPFLISLPALYINVNKIIELYIYFYIIVMVLAILKKLSCKWNKICYHCKYTIISDVLILPARCYNQYDLHNITKFICRMHLHCILYWNFLSLQEEWPIWSVWHMWYWMRQIECLIWVLNLRQVILVFWL